MPSNVNTFSLVFHDTKKCIFFCLLPITLCTLGMYTPKNRSMVRLNNSINLLKGFKDSHV